MTALKPIVLADFSDFESDEDSDDVPIMAPRSISPMDQEYTTNLTQIAQSQSQTLSPVKPSYNYNSLLSPIMAPRSPSSSAPSAVKLKQESIQQMNEIVDLTSISSDSELEFITTEIIDLTLQVKKRKKKKRKRNKKRNRKKHKKDAKKEVIEIIAISSESESDGLLEGDETRHKEVKPSLSASSTVQQIRKEVQKVCYNHIQFKDRVEFLVSMLQTILQCETSHEGHRANDDGNVSILIISPRRHSANYIYGLIKAFMTEISSSLCTGGIYSHYQASIICATPGKLIWAIKENKVQLHNVMSIIIESKDQLQQSEELRHQLRQITRHLPQSTAMNLIYTNTNHWNESYDNFKYLGDFKEDIKILQKLSHFVYVVEKKSIEHLKTLLAHIKNKDQNAKIIVFFGTKMALKMAYDEMITDNVSRQSIMYLDGSCHVLEREKILESFRNDTGGMVLLTSDVIAGSVSHCRAVIINYSHGVGGERYMVFKGYIQRATLSNVNGKIYNIVTPQETPQEWINEELKKYRIRMKDFHQMMRGAKPPHGHRKRDRERWVYKRRRERERDKRKERAKERERSRHRARRRGGGSDYGSDMCEGYEGKHRRRRHTRY
eukprot:364719_1